MGIDGETMEVSETMEKHVETAEKHGNPVGIPLETKVFMGKLWEKTHQRNGIRLKHFIDLPAMIFDDQTVDALQKHAKTRLIT